MLKAYTVWWSTGKFDGSASFEKYDDAFEEFEHQQGQRGVVEVELTEKLHGAGIEVLQRWSAKEEAAEQIEDVDDEPDGRCTNPKGHEYAYTGTAYGGDDESYHGEGRCYCIYCGADGDG